MPALRLRRKDSTVPTYRYPPLVRTPGDEVVESILREIAVRAEVLEEAKRRRNTVCDLAMSHQAARDTWFSGSIAHGTHNAPLGDADCGVMVDRRFEAFRAFGPDAQNGGKGPEDFIQSFSGFIAPLLAEAGYPRATIDLSGNRAIKVEFNEPIEFDDLGVVDPFVDLIIGLERREGPGVWIPNRRRGGWDPAHPQRHTELMTQCDPDVLVVHRAHLIRLGKRAVKRDGQRNGTPAMCSWNLSALALGLVEEKAPIATALADMLAGAAVSIERELTDDPAGVSGRIRLPDGMTQERAAERLAWMASTVRAAAAAGSVFEARRLLVPLFGVEIDTIREREVSSVRRQPLNDALLRRDAAGVTAAIGAAETLKSTRSHGV